MGKPIPWKKGLAALLWLGLLVGQVQAGPVPAEVAASQGQRTQFLEETSPSPKNQFLEQEKEAIQRRRINLLAERLKGYLPPAPVQAPRPEVNDAEDSSTAESVNPEPECQIVTLKGDDLGEINKDNCLLVNRECRGVECGVVEDTVCDQCPEEVSGTGFNVSKGINVADLASKIFETKINPLILSQIQKVASSESSIPQENLERILKEVQKQLRSVVESQISTALGQSVTRQCQLVQEDVCTVEDEEECPEEALGEEASDQKAMEEQCQSLMEAKCSPVNDQECQVIRETVTEEDCEVRPKVTTTGCHQDGNEATGCQECHIIKDQVCTEITTEQDCDEKDCDEICETVTDTECKLVEQCLESNTPEECALSGAGEEECSILVQFECTDLDSEQDSDALEEVLEPCSKFEQCHSNITVEPCAEDEKANCQVVEDEVCEEVMETKCTKECPDGSQEVPIPDECQAATEEVCTQVEETIMESLTEEVCSEEQEEGCQPECFTELTEECHPVDQKCQTILKDQCETVYDTVTEVQCQESVQSCQDVIEQVCDKCQTSCQPVVTKSVCDLPTEVEECHTLQQVRCDPITENQCTTSYRKQCQIIHDEKCSHEYEDHCTTEYVESCHQVPADPDSYRVYAFMFEHDNQINYKTECQKVPRTVCQRQSQPVCSKIPREDCTEVPETTCKEVSKESCYSTPVTTCSKVVKQSSNCLNTTENVCTSNCDNPTCRQETRKVCSKAPLQQSCQTVEKEVPRQVCTQERVQQCQESSLNCTQVPKEVCKECSAPREVCKSVEKLVPKIVTSTQCQQETPVSCASPRPDAVSVCQEQCVQVPSLQCRMVPREVCQTGNSARSSCGGSAHGCLGLPEMVKCVAGDEIALETTLTKICRKNATEICQPSDNPTGQGCPSRETGGCQPREVCNPVEREVCSPSKSCQGCQKVVCSEVEREVCQCDGGGNPEPSDLSNCISSSGQDEELVCTPVDRLVEQEVCQPVMRLDCPPDDPDLAKVCGGGDVKSEAKVCQRVPREVCRPVTKEVCDQAEILEPGSNNDPDPGPLECEARCRTVQRQVCDEDGQVTLIKPYQEASEPQQSCINVYQCKVCT